MIAVLIHKLLYVNSKRRRSEPGLLEFMICVDAFCSALMIWYYGRMFFS